MSSLHILHKTHSSSHCLMMSYDFHPGAWFSVFSQLSWKCEVSGEWHHCSPRCASKCSAEPCWKICCQTTKSFHLCDYIQIISHAGIQAEKPRFIKNQVFFAFAFAKHVFYFYHTHPPRMLSKIILQYQNPARFTNLSHFSLNPISVSHKYGPEKVDFLRQPALSLPCIMKPNFHNPLTFRLPLPCSPEMLEGFKNCCSVPVCLPTLLY